jgi:DMSO/TMAO reductase YedYZ heme-binding membrane subunit
MSQHANQLRRAPTRNRIAVYTAGALALLPLAMESREIVTGDFAGLSVSNADVLGTGSLLIFLSMLAVTPLAALTGKRWFVPLRWWFGVVFFANALTDLVIASIVSGSDFPGGFLTRVAGHTFLAVGMLAVLLSSVLAATASHRAQQRLGRYWKAVQRTTYVVWALILLHLALLFGFGAIGGSIFYDALSASAPLALLRVPAVSGWAVSVRRERGGRDVVLWAVGLVLLAAFLYGYGELVSTLFNRGLNALSTHPSND